MPLTETYFDIVETGDESWGNVFLTNDWTLHVDRTRQQHDAAMERLGVHHRDVLVSGCLRPEFAGTRLTIGWRSAPGEDRGEISNEEARMLMRAIERTVLGRGESRKCF